MPWAQLGREPVVVEFDRLFVLAGPRTNEDLPDCKVCVWGGGSCGPASHQCVCMCVCVFGGGGGREPASHQGVCVCVGGAVNLPRIKVCVCMGGEGGREPASRQGVCVGGGKKGREPASHQGVCVWGGRGAVNLPHIKVCVYGEGGGP